MKKLRELHRQVERNDTLKETLHQHKNTQSIRVMQMHMIGKILANFSHEVKNHLALIKESSGLIGDIIGSKQPATVKDCQKSMDILYSCTKQIGKTSELCNILNRFAHRMDCPLSTFSVNESLEELVILLQKIASQKAINLEKDFQGAIPAIYGDSTLFQLIVFCSIEEILGRYDQNGVITVKTEFSNGHIVIHIQGNGTAAGSIREGICTDEMRKQIMDSLSGDIAQKEEGIIITLPVTIPPVTKSH